MEDTIKKIIEEYRLENQINPNREDSEFENYVKEGIYDINDFCGTEIDYEKDLDARCLLKNYVLYSNSKRLAEFKSLYMEEYHELQRNYYINSKL